MTKGWRRNQEIFFIMELNENDNRAEQTWQWIFTENSQNPIEEEKLQVFWLRRKISKLQKYTKS